MASKFWILIIVGTSALPRRASSSIRSRDSPVPCSTESTPARTSVATAASENVCAATRTPAACATSIAAATCPGSNAGARSPAARSIQSPTSLTHPLPSLACSATAAARSSPATSSPTSLRYRPIGATCRPARASRGTSWSSSSWGYRKGEPASRMASVPAARSIAASSLASATSPIGPPPGRIPIWQCASTSPGRMNPLVLTVSAPGTGSKVTRSPSSHRSRTSSSGRSTPRTCSAMRKRLVLKDGREGLRDHPVPGGVRVDVRLRTAHPGPLADPRHVQRQAAHHRGHVVRRERAGHVGHPDATQLVDQREQPVELMDQRQRLLRERLPGRPDEVRRERRVVVGHPGDRRVRCRVPQRDDGAEEVQRERQQRLMEAVLVDAGGEADAAVDVVAADVDGDQPYLVPVRAQERERRFELGHAARVRALPAGDQRPARLAGAAEVRQLQRRLLRVQAPVQLLDVALVEDAARLGAERQPVTEGEVLRPPVGPARRGGPRGTQRESGDHDDAGESA